MGTIRISGLALIFFFSAFGLYVSAQIIEIPPEVPPIDLPQEIQPCLSLDDRRHYIRNPDGFDLIYNENRGCLIPAPGVYRRATST